MNIYDYVTIVDPFYHDITSFILFPINFVIREVSEKNNMFLEMVYLCIKTIVNIYKGLLLYCLFVKKIQNLVPS